jgi:hypothetical protein
LLTKFRLEKAELPCFPYMGTFVTDAVFAWDGKVCVFVSSFLGGSMPTLQLQGERAMKFSENCIDLRRPVKVAGIVINNLSQYQKHQ